jgi:hypothetical protein
VFLASGGDGDGLHGAGVGAFDGFALQVRCNFRVVNQAVSALVQVINFWRNGVALTVALADIPVDLDAHGILLGSGLACGGSATILTPALTTAHTGITRSPRAFTHMHLGNPGVLSAAEDLTGSWRSRRNGRGRAVLIDLSTPETMVLT